MRIYKNIKNFLYDQEYFIDIFNNLIHVYYYEKIIHLASDLITLKLNTFTLEITGKDLVVKQMDKKEILIQGIIDNLRFIR